MERAAQEQELEQTQENALTTATYDGWRVLKMNGEVLRKGDAWWRLVKHVLVLQRVTTIGFSAFEGCTSLSSVTFPEGLTEIRGGAFYGCTSLSSVTLPEGLTVIGGAAFMGCTILEQRSRAAGHPNVVSYLRFISSRAYRRYLVLASLARLRDELYARQAKRARLAADGAARSTGEEEEEEEEEAGSLMGVLAFEMIHSDDLWRHILEFL